ncbi:unnamed protein product, partial [Symbiodinium natans]
RAVGALVENASSQTSQTSLEERQFEVQKLQVLLEAMSTIPDREAEEDEPVKWGSSTRDGTERARSKTVLLAEVTEAVKHLDAASLGDSVDEVEEMKQMLQSLHAEFQQLEEEGVAVALMEQALAGVKSVLEIAKAEHEAPPSDHINLQAQKREMWKDVLNLMPTLSERQQEADGSDCDEYDGFMDVEKPVVSEVSEAAPWSASTACSSTESSTPLVPVVDAAGTPLVPRVDAARTPSGPWVDSAGTALVPRVDAAGTVVWVDAAGAPLLPKVDAAGHSPANREHPLYREVMVAPGHVAWEAHDVRPGPRRPSTVPPISRPEAVAVASEAHDVQHELGRPSTVPPVSLPEAVADCPKAFCRFLVSTNPDVKAKRKKHFQRRSISSIRMRHAGGKSVEAVVSWRMHHGFRADRDLPRLPDYQPKLAQVHHAKKPCICVDCLMAAGQPAMDPLACSVTSSLSTELRASGARSRYAAQRHRLHLADVRSELRDPFRAGATNKFPS